MSTDRTPTNGAGAGAASIFAAAGIPWVVWSEGVMTSRHDVRAARLVPDFLSTQVTATATTATFVSRLRTYGVAYPVAFAWGAAGAGLPARTPLTTVAGEETPIAATVSGLRRKTSYEVQPLALAFGEERGAVVSFKTTRRQPRT